MKNKEHYVELYATYKTVCDSALIIITEEKIFKKNIEGTNSYAEICIAKCLRFFESALPIIFY